LSNKAAGRETAPRPENGLRVRSQTRQPKANSAKDTQACAADSVREKPPRPQPSPIWGQYRDARSSRFLPVRPPGEARPTFLNESGQDGSVHEQRVICLFHTARNQGGGWWKTICSRKIYLERENEYTLAGSIYKGPRHARAARHAVRLRRHRIGARCLPLCFRLYGVGRARRGFDRRGAWRIAVCRICAPRQFAPKANAWASPSWKRVTPSKRQPGLRAKRPAILRAPKSMRTSNHRSRPPSRQRLLPAKIPQSVNAEAGADVDAVVADVEMDVAMAGTGMRSHAKQAQR
jgi:hypothetical protein